MHIFVLTIDCTNYDQYDQHVIVSQTKDQAIKMAMNKSADEGPDIWLRATIENIGIYNGPEENDFIVCSSFNAG